MPNVYDVKEPCTFSNKPVFFDTNVWININGFDPRPEYRVYSDFYSSLLKKNNEVVVTDLVLSEFFNRCCKLQHNVCLETKVTNERQFKKFRLSKDFQPYSESVRDTCLNIVDDCNFDQFQLSKESVSNVIEESAKGRLDYNDIVIRELCKERGYILVTHDYDFANCGFDIATANRRILKGHA